MKHLDLFSGIGGFALAASWVWGDEHEIVSFVEIDPFCQKVLNKHWPDVPMHLDIRSLDYEKIMACAAISDARRRERLEKGQKPDNGKSPQLLFDSSGGSRNAKGGCDYRIDLITGGFPCQPVSAAGKRRGSKDDRWLWPEMLRIIREVRPTWVIGENVAGIINMELDGVLSDLEDSAYEVQPFLIPACAVDAPHRRDRVWIVANDEKRNVTRALQEQGGKSEISAIGKTIRGHCQHSRALANPFVLIERKHSIRWPSRIGWWKREPKEALQNIRKKRRKETRVSELKSQLGRVANGIPNRVDRLRSLGNAIVPQVVVPIMQAIKEIENNLIVKECEKDLKVLKNGRI